MSFHFVSEYCFPDIVFSRDAPGNLKFMQQEYREQDNHEGNTDDNPQGLTTDLSPNHGFFRICSVSADTRAATTSQIPATTSSSLHFERCNSFRRRRSDRSGGRSPSHLVCISYLRRIARKPRAGLC